MRAPDFQLPDQNGIMHHLTDYRGKWVIVYFYPKDDTPGCTKEACGFRDTEQELKKLGVVIFGISKDSVASHKKFSEKFHLNFSLLSDESKEAIKAYQAWGIKKFMGREFEGIKRTTVLVDPSGEIAKRYEAVNPLIHAPQIITDLQTLKR